MSNIEKIINILGVMPCEDEDFIEMTSLGNNYEGEQIYE